MDGDRKRGAGQENLGGQGIMSGRSPIFLGDLVRALAIAGKDAAEPWPAIAILLGFCRAEPKPPPPPVIPPSRDGRIEKPLATEGSVTETDSTMKSAQDIGDLVEFDFEHSTAPAQPVPQVGGSEPEPKRGPPLRLPSMLDPAWERGILIEAVGRPVAEGDIAIPEAVELIARGSPLADMPREVVTSVAKGCQVLIDMGTGMRPFARDARALADSVRRAIGAEHTWILTFVDCPTQGVMTEDYRDCAYLPPENGGLVLALSDLCCGGARGMIREAEPEDWLTVAKRIRDAGSQLVVFNPYPPGRWPKAVVDHVPIVYWDRTTRTADVRRTRRRVRG
jgi:hypothetical protein